MLCSRIMSTSDPNITVTYSSGTNEKLGTSWDVMHVVYHREEHGVKRIANSFVIARDLGGTIIRKTDIILDRWEVVRDEEMLQAFQRCFENRDRLAAERVASVTASSEQCPRNAPRTYQP
jgi:hypothetical protein